MEQLIKDLNDPVNQSSPATVDDLQKKLQALQRKKSAWQTGLDLLNNDDATVRFYGALTLTIKINSDWEADGILENAANNDRLSHGLIEGYVRLSNDQEKFFVLRKLCTSLTAYFIKSEWSLPIRQICFAFLGHPYSPESEPVDPSQLDTLFRALSIPQLRALLLLAQQLSEDMNRLDQGTPSGAAVLKRLVQNANDVWLLIHVCLEIIQNTGSLDPDHIEIVRLAVWLIPTWYPHLSTKLYGNTQDSFQDTVRLVEYNIFQLFTCFEAEILAVDVMQVLTELLEIGDSPTKNLLHNGLMKISSSTQAGTWIQELREGNFSPAGIGYVELLIAMVLNQDLNTDRYLIHDGFLPILQVLLKLLSCEGAAGVEDEVCQMVVDCISYVFEGFMEWAPNSPIQNIMKSLILDFCIQAAQKAQYPEQEMEVGTQIWDSDDLVRFRDFRNDVEDLFNKAFIAIGPPLFKKVAVEVLTPTRQVPWSVIECGFFILTAFSESMEDDKSDYDDVVGPILQLPQWRMATTNITTPVRVRQAAIRFITAETAYLQRHAGQLVPCLNFLFSALSLPDSALSAARAIQTLCLTQRSLLVEGLPQFLDALSMVSNLQSDEKTRIFGSVAAIIQAMPSEEAKIDPLVSMLIMISLQYEKFQASANNNNEDKVSNASDTMQTLAATGKGLRAPATAVIDLESTQDSQLGFWTLGPGQPVQERILSLCISIINNPKFKNHPEIVEGACNVFKSGYTEIRPSPFKFLPRISVDFLSSQIRLDSPRIEVVMGCASAFLASLDPKTNTGILPMLLQPVLTTFQGFSSNLQEQEIDFAASVLDFLTRLLPKWATTWSSLERFEESVGLILQYCLLLLENPDTLPKRMAAGFVAALIDVSGPKTGTSSINPSFIPPEYYAQITGSLLRQIAGECSRSELDALSEPLKKLIKKESMVVKPLLREAMKAEAGVLSAKALQATTFEQRSRFVAQLELLKGSTKTGEVVKQFWISCRGDAFDYITS